MKSFDKCWFAHVAQVILLGMLVRIAWVILVPVEPVSDGYAYDTFARNILHHGVYGWTVDEPTAYWPVGTSAILAAAYCLLGESYFSIVLLNLLSSLATMMLIWEIGKKHFGSEAGFFSVVVVAFWPNLIFFCSIISSELYFISLVLGGLYFWTNDRGKLWVNLLLCGLIWGLACYVKPVVLLLPLAMLIASMSRGLPIFLKTALKSLAVIALIVLVVSPWANRNEEVIGKRYLVSSNFGANLWMGNNPQSDGGYTPLPERVEGMSEVERDEFLLEEAKSYIQEDWTRFFIAVGKRVLYLHGGETIGVAWNDEALPEWFGNGGRTMLKLLASLYWIGLVFGGLLSIIVLWPENKFAAVCNPMLGGWWYFIVVHALIVGGDRYHMPSAPFIAILCGASLAWVFRKRQMMRVNIL